MCRELIVGVKLGPIKFLELLWLGFMYYWQMGVGKVLNKILYGRLSPEVRPITLFYIIFDRKCTPFLCLLLANGTLSHALIITLHHLMWLNTVLQAVSGNSRDGDCFKLDKQTMVQRRWFLKIYSLIFCDIWHNFYFYRILNNEKNLLSVYFSLAKFQLVRCNLSLAMIWQMTHSQTAKTVFSHLNLFITLNCRKNALSLRCFDTVFRRPYRYFSIALKGILSVPIAIKFSLVIDYGLKFVKM